MKRTVLFFAFMILGVVFANADTFTGALSESESREAGIDRLSEAQRAKLNDLVERFTRGEVVREVTVATEEREDKEALENPRKGPKLIETRVLGSFQGWRGGTIFRLENGEIWQQTNPESYKSSKPFLNPKAVLKKSPIGGYWMHVEGFPGVRVTRIQ